MTHEFDVDPIKAQELIDECQRDFGLDCGFTSAEPWDGIPELEIGPKLAVKCIASVCHLDGDPYKLFGGGK